MLSRSLLTPIAVTGAVAAAVTTAVLVKRRARSRLPPSTQPSPELPDISVSTTDVSLSELTPSSRGTAAERGDAYDAVGPDDLGAEWLARATEANPIREPESLDPTELQTLDLDELSEPEASELEASEPAVKAEPTQTVPRAVFDPDDPEQSS